MNTTPVFVKIKYYSNRWLTFPRRLITLMLLLSPHNNFVSTICSRRVRYVYVTCILLLRALTFIYMYIVHINYIIFLKALRDNLS